MLPINIVISFFSFSNNNKRLILIFYFTLFSFVFFKERKTIIKVFVKRFDYIKLKLLSLIVH